MLWRGRAGKKVLARRNGNHRTFYGEHVTALPAALGKFVRMIKVLDNWPRALVDHLGLSRGDYLYRLHDGSTFEVRGGTDDRHVLFEIFVERIYDAPIGPGDVVVDIGANIGGFTVLAARNGASVISFEPFPTNFAILERNCKRNEVRATLTRCAVAGVAGSQVMYLPDDQNMSGRYSLHPGRGSSTITIDSVTLDQIVEEHKLDRIDLLKIDCQGSEYEILYQTSDSVLDRVQRIIVECEVFPDKPEWSVEELSRYLARHGFSVGISERLIHATRDAPPQGAHDQRV